MNALELISRRERKQIEIERSRDYANCGVKSGGDIWTTYVTRQLLVPGGGGYVRMEFCGVAFEIMELETDELPMSENGRTRPMILGSQSNPSPNGGLQSIMKL
jgi:hypothetical protein